PWLFGDCRQLDQESCSTLFFVAAGNLPAVLLDDAVTHAQSKTGSLADRPCRIEGIENSGRLRYARPIVAEFDFDAIIGCECLHGQNASRTRSHRGECILNDLCEDFQ